jgi:S1-C subfamily serine protease
MWKTSFVLLFAFIVVLAVSVCAQSSENVTFKVTVVDSGLSLKNVPKFPLVIRKTGERESAESKVSTSAVGVATVSLQPGNYVVASEKPLAFESRNFSWEQPFTVESGKTVNLELSSDNARITEERKDTARDISRGGKMFKTLRDGVVTIMGELGSGTGFIVDETGLVLTNQHVIDQSNEIRVRFDKYTAVKARVLAVDEERDLAVLQINLAAFANSRVLKLAAKSSAEPPVVEGEHVFTIGSPLHQEKILSSGIVSKIEPKAIITDISFNSGDSGAPLFNSLGQVVGISTFMVKDRAAAAFASNQMSDEGSGMSGIVTIDEAQELIAKARALAATKGVPSAALMPNMPDGAFPIETIKTALRSKDFPLKVYVSDVKNYEIKYMTPIYKFYVMEKDRIESLKNREKRNKEKGMPDTADPFRDLRYWSEYAGELRPVVQILALPETGASGASMALSLLSQGVIGYATPLDQKYKADFYQMKLMCDGQEVIPLVRNKTEIVRDLQNYYKSRKRYSYAGVYSYAYDVFAPGRCQQMQVQIFSEEDIETPITSEVPEATKTRVWTDFQDFRTQIAKSQVEKEPR